MIRNGILFILTYVFLSPFTWTKTLYNIKDLEILESEGSYEEFILHAKDIRPSERDKHWTKLLRSSAVGLLDKYLKQKKIDQSSFKKIENLANWRQLKTDEFFQVKRNSFQLNYFRNCFVKKQDQCLGQLKGFWNSSNQDIDLGFKLISLVKGFYPKFNTWYMTKKVANSNLSNFYCHKEVIRDEILYQIHVQENANIISSECWGKLKKDFLKILERPNSIYFNALYKAFEDRNLLSEEQKDYFLTLYFLQSPTKGKILNQAWNRITEISQDVERRLPLVNKLLDHDPLPGKIFGFKGKDSLETFSRHFAKSIPEYMDGYARTCVNYMSGAVKYPRGNPTLECQNLFSKMDGRPWVSQTLKLQYSAVKKF